jgi:hypothetical protein
MQDLLFLDFPFTEWTLVLIPEILALAAHNQVPAIENNRVSAVCKAYDTQFLIVQLRIVTGEPLQPSSYNLFGSEILNYTFENTFYLSEIIPVYRPVHNQVQNRVEHYLNIASQYLVHKMIKQILFRSACHFWQH